MGACSNLSIATIDPFMTGIGGALIVVGMTLLVWLVRVDRRLRARPADSLPPADQSDSIVSLVLATMDPALREYIQTSADPAAKTGRPGQGLTMRRIVSLWQVHPADRRAAILLKQLTTRVADFESRLCDMDAKLKHVEHHSVTNDRVLTIVIGALAVMVTLIGGMATVVVAVAGAGG